MIAATLAMRRRLSWVSLALGVGIAVQGCSAPKPYA